MIGRNRSQILRKLTEAKPGETTMLRQTQCPPLEIYLGPAYFRHVAFASPIWRVSCHHAESPVAFSHTLIGSGVRRCEGERKRS